MGKLVLNGEAYIGGASGGSGGTDEKVKQSPVSDSNNYRVILSDTATDTEETADVNKSNKLSFNPQSGVLRVGRTSLESGENSTVGKIQLFRVEMGGTVKSMLIDPNSGIIGDSSNFDILLLSGTWDGTHDSLKDALASGGGGGVEPSTSVPFNKIADNVNGLGGGQIATLSQDSSTLTLNLIDTADYSAYCGQGITDYIDLTNIDRIKLTAEGTFAGAGLARAYVIPRAKSSDIDNYYMVAGWPKVFNWEYWIDLEIHEAGDYYVDVSKYTGDYYILVIGFTGLYSGQQGDCQNWMLGNVQADFKLYK